MLKHSSFAQKFTDTELSIVLPDINFTLTKKCNKKGMTKLKISAHVSSKPDNGQFISVNEKYSNLFDIPSAFSFNLSFVKLDFTLRYDFINISGKGYENKTVQLENKTEFTLKQLNQGTQQGSTFQSTNNFGEVQNRKVESNNLLKGSNPNSFSIEYDPVITDVSPTTWTTGDKITVTGENFVPYETFPTNSNVTGGTANRISIVCENTPVFAGLDIHANFINSTKIEFTAPLNCYGNTVVQYERAYYVPVNGDFNNGFYTKFEVVSSFPGCFSNVPNFAPTITEITPSSGKTSTRINITGTNFKKNPLLYFYKLDEEGNFTTYFGGVPSKVKKNLIVTTVDEIFAQFTETDQNLSNLNGTWILAIFEDDTSKNVSLASPVYDYTTYTITN